ncbi:MAG: CBS domain-containing protein [Hyphomicrobiaceae bacterium]
MKICDLMTSSVLTVDPATPVARIARLLFDHAISAVPVVEAHVPVGIVSEGDLVWPRVPNRELQSNRLLRAIFATAAEAGDFGRPDAANWTARDVMSAPVITSTDDSSVAEIVGLMAAHDIKRVPIVRNGRLVGIVSRADLIGAFASGLQRPGEAATASVLGAALIGLDKKFLDAERPIAGRAQERTRRHEPSLTAADFRNSVELHRERDAIERAEIARREAERHEHDIEVILGTHVSDDDWHRLLLAARHAAENGERDFQLLRFPRETCSDGGRRIGIGAPDWPTTLRGEAAEIWMRFARELKGGGFRLVARTIEYHNDIPGDLGLWIVWGDGRE